LTQNVTNPIIFATVHIKLTHVSAPEDSFVTICQNITTEAERGKQRHIVILETSVWIGKIEKNGRHRLLSACAK